MHWNYCHSEADFIGQESAAASKTADSSRDTAALRNDNFDDGSYSTTTKLWGRCVVGPKGFCARVSRQSVFGLGQGHVHQMLAQEPYLQFVGAENVADGQVVGAVVAQFVGALGELAALPDDDLMGIEQSRELHRDF